MKFLNNIGDFDSRHGCLSLNDEAPASLRTLYRCIRNVTVDLGRITDGMILERFGMLE
jgi:hypothetical protein